MENKDLISDYINYATIQLIKFDEITKLHENHEVTPEMINYALSIYENVTVGLIGEYKRICIEKWKLEKNYRLWYNKKFLEIKNKLNSESGSKNTKIALKEYEIELQVDYEEEYWNWQDQLKIMEEKESFVGMILERWKKYDNILVQMSSNAKSEMSSLGLSDKIDNYISYAEKAKRSRPKI